MSKRPSDSDTENVAGDGLYDVLQAKPPLNENRTAVQKRSAHAHINFGAFDRSVTSCRSQATRFPPPRPGAGGFPHRDLLKRSVKTFGRERLLAPVPALLGDI
jgi:hypothetical protein